MPGRFEQMRVGVEGHACAGVPEDAADLDDVETNVDDQMAGEGMTRIVEAHPSVWPIEPCAGGGAAKHTLGHVVVQKRRAVTGREHVVGAAREAGAAFVLAENRGELGKERDLADRRARLRGDSVRRDAAAAASHRDAGLSEKPCRDIVAADAGHVVRHVAGRVSAHVSRRLVSGCGVAGGLAINEAETVEALRHTFASVLGPEHRPALFGGPALQLGPPRALEVLPDVARPQPLDVCSHGQQPVEVPDAALLLGAHVADLARHPAFRKRSFYPPIGGALCRLEQPRRPRLRGVVPHFPVRILDERGILGVTASDAAGHEANLFSPREQILSGRSQRQQRHGAAVVVDVRLELALEREPPTRRRRTLPARHRRPLAAPTRP